ncbi:MAG TPA: SAM-dependent DNA methyltransferase [Nitrospirae bacterium]|nr:SAM-dependent DNA methyltransferase [Nitrospirota bacterium]
MTLNFTNSDLRQKVDQLMDELYAGGVNNPMTAIDVTLSEAFEKFHELPNLSPMGKLLFRQAHLKIFNRPTLRSVVAVIDGMDYNDTRKYDTDVKGDLYEYLLSKIVISGTNGQFRTPLHIIKMMVNLLKPKAG